MIIKKIHIYLLINILASFCVNPIFAQSDSVYTITGKINGLQNDQWVWLQNADDNQLQIDSVKTNQGEFIFSGSVKNPTLYRINIGKSTKESFPLFIENNKITVQCDYKYPFTCEVRGSYNQHLVDEFAIRERLAWNPEVIENLKATYINFNEKAGYIRKQKFTEAIKTFVDLHTNDRAVAYLVSVNSNYILDSELENIYNLFGENLRSSDFAKEIKTEVDMRNLTKIGQNLSFIRQKDLNGDLVKLSDFKDKYVLLHFWASGFEPARTENYKLKKIYDKYRHKEFEVIAISLDSVEASLDRAILEDNLDWTNVSDLKGWNNEIAKKLGIQLVPFSILVDREGKIIARDFQPEELDNILNVITSARATLAIDNPQKKQKPLFSKWFPKKTKKTNSGALPGAKNSN